MRWIIVALSATTAAFTLTTGLRLAACAWFNLPPDGGDLSLALLLVIWMQVVSALRPRTLSLTLTSRSDETTQP